MSDRIQIAPIMEGRFMLDGGAMFGIVPKPLWTRTNPADENNRIELGARCMLIRHPEAGNILVDAGIGQKWDEKGRRIYNIRHQDSPGGPALGIEASLAAQGLTPADIDHVVMTHLHFDHAGGLTKVVERDGRAQVAPTFPGRPHYVMREHWSWAHAPSERDAGSFHAEDFSFLEDGLEGTSLHLLDGLTELFPGVTLIPRRGHTPSMACVLVEAADGPAIFLADLIPTAGHIRIPYVMGYDLEPRITCLEKREILAEASRHGWRLFFEHDPYTPWCHVEPDGHGAWRQVPSSNDPA